MGDWFHCPCRKGWGASNAFVPKNGPKAARIRLWLKRFACPSNAGEALTMPARGHQKSDPVDHRIRVQLTAAQAEQLARLAADAGVSQSEYMRSLLDSANKVPKPRRQSGTMLQLVEIHELAMQVKKLGTNVNQLARQANAGLVPLRREEIQQMLAQHEELMVRAIALVEKALPG
jgi:hypothetical protein